MNKMKVFLATVCCLFMMGSAKAQFGTGMRVNTFTVIFDGYGGWAPTTYSNLFTFRINTANYPLTQVFNGPGTRTFTTMNSFGNINITFGNNWGINTTYNDFVNNSVVIGQQYSHWIDTWNGREWYMYEVKVAPNVWRIWFGN